MSAHKINATVAALRFFFRVTLDRPRRGGGVPAGAPTGLSSNQRAAFGARPAFF
jgi:hypothetical protein